jgi:hypothetical protein
MSPLAMKALVLSSGNPEATAIHVVCEIREIVQTPCRARRASGTAMNPRDEETQRTRRFVAR